MKKILSILLALMLSVALLAGCSIQNGEKTADEATKVPEASAVPATDVPATEVPATEVPVTEEPATQAPTKEPKPTPDAGNLDAILIDLEDDLSISVSACEAEVKAGEPFLTVVSDTGDINFTLTFEDSFSAEDYPYIAFKYRIGFGASIRNTNHFYAITAGGVPVPQDGWWNDIDFVYDLDWHVAILNLAEMFPAATEAGDWSGLRFPAADEKGCDFCLAWVGAFTSEEDIAKYDEAYNAVYGDKLVKAQETVTDKEESIPDLEDAFDETVLDFEDAEEGLALQRVVSYPYGFKPGTGASKCIEDNGGIAGDLSFDAIYYDGIIKNGQAYTATFQLKNSGTESNFGGFVFNWGDEGNTSRDFFENNGLEKDGAGSLVSKSGCGVFFLGGNRVKIYVPTWDAEKSKKTYASATVEYDIDFSKQFTTFKVVDNGTDTVTVYADETVMFTVSYSGDGLSRAAGCNERYYKTIVVKAADGTELFSSDNALFSYYKSFALAGRAHSVIVDNIQVVNN